MTMTHVEFKAARKRMGLTLNQLADLLQMQGGDAHRLLRRYESEPERKDARPVPPYLALLMRILAKSPEARRIALAMRQQAIIDNDPVRTRRHGVVGAGDG